MLKIWDRKTNINGTPAEDYLGNHPEISSGEETVLYCNDMTGRVEEVFNVDTIRSILEITEKLDPITIIQKFMDQRKEENERINQDQIDISKYTEEFSVRLANIEYQLLSAK